MINEFCRKPLWEVSRILAAVAQGHQPADMVIRRGRLVNVCTHEIQDSVDVAIAAGRIALVGDASHCIGPETNVIEADGAYIAPGFLDGHLHVESSMLSVGEYARAVVPHGTVGIYMDPHEICNVLGKDGVKLMIEDSLRTPLKTMVTVPSCVPAVPGFEDTGAAIGPEDIQEMMSWPRVVGLGEMMNYPGVLAGAEAVYQELAETMKADKVITGHYSTPETGMGLNAYIASGACCCHESTTAESALTKMRLGMYAQLREGSAWHDLHDLAPVIVSGKVDSRFACLVSDDAHPHTLRDLGHLDHILRRALEEGIDPITAIQMVTINTASCFRMAHELGSVTPGKCADIVLLESLETMKVCKVIIDGELAAENGKLAKEMPPFVYPDWATAPLNVGRELTPADFRIPAPEGAGDRVKARAIQVIAAKSINTETFVELPVQDGEVLGGVDDVCKAFVFERHNASGLVGKGFVRGFGIRRGALAQTVAHDAHNLIVIGNNEEDMALAANTLIRCGGGLCAVADGRVLAEMPLPIAGLMNDKPAEEMAAMADGLGSAWKETGCTLPSPYMTMASLSLACIPELRLTNRGLVDCRDYTFAELFVN